MFEYHGDARKQRNHILANLCRRVKQPTGFILHTMLTPKNITEMPRKLPIRWCYVLLTQNVHISPQTLGKMGHQISHFCSHFQNTKTLVMFRRWPFSLTLKKFMKNSNPLQSYSHFSKLFPSKPPEHSTRTCAALYSPQRA